MKKYLIVIFILLVSVLVLLIFLRPHSKVQAPPSPTSLQVKTYSPHSGEVFSNVLKRAEIPDQVISSLIKALQDVKFKFTTIRPIDTLKFLYRNDTLVEMEYKKDYTTVYRCKIDTNNITVAMDYKEINCQMTLVKGEISSSLYESMIKIGEKPMLIANYADVLAWEIDFFTETQNGDSFFVLVEKKFADTVCIDYGRIVAVRYKGKIGDFYGYYFVDPKGNRDYFDKDGKSLRKAFLKSPLKYSYISSYFSNARYHPILKIVRPHRGIDYVAPSGTPVSAIGDGTVTFAGWKGGYGNFVEIVHNQRFKSRYGHLRKFGSGIRSGRRVAQGQIVGYVGATGLATGPHLHFELLQNGTWVNPLRIIPPRAEPVKPEYFPEFTKHRDSLNLCLIANQ